MQLILIDEQIRVKLIALILKEYRKFKQVKNVRIHKIKAQ